MMVKVFSSLTSDIEFKSRKYSYVLLFIPVFNPFHGLLHLVFNPLFYVFENIKQFSKTVNKETPNQNMQWTSNINMFCDAPIRGCPLTTRQPAEYSWMSGNPTLLTKIGQSLFCMGSFTQGTACPKHMATCPNV